MESGSSLGPYRIEGELGSGGMGRVYAAVVEGRASGLDEGERVALKVVHAHLLESPDAVERFRREVEIGKTVRHPNVVRTFDGGEADGRHYMAMEYVEGQTLDGLLGELERVPEELCRHIGREVCKGLAAIHAAGAIHRDVKPENIIIALSEARPDDDVAERPIGMHSRDGDVREGNVPRELDHVVKIMDLGVARSTDDALRLSQTGAFVGSLHYAAPEQFTGGGKGLDARTDLHALGLVLYELASGFCPYYADDVPQTVRKVLHDEPRRLGEINPQLSAFLEEVVHCLIAKDRDERFSTADELHAVLDAGEDCPWWHDRARALQLANNRPVRRARIPRETAVYGREDEIAKLRALYARAKSGDGNVVLIDGEAGIGKSRLVDELIGRLQEQGEDINFLFGGYPPGGAATVEGGFSSAYREQFGEAGSAAFLPENQILVPAFDALLRGEGAPPDAQSLTKGSLQTCFVRATQTLAAERMTIVLIDDLHFAPEEGRALFTSLAMAVPEHRVLLIGTTRPGVSDDWMSGLTRLEQTDRLALHRLGPKDLVQLLQDTLQSEQLARDLGNQIAVKSDGNPFFVFEILRGLREGQFITRADDGTWVGTKVVDDVQIPSTVLDLVNARVAELSQEERDVVDVACCSGFEFDPLLVGEVVGLARIPLLKLLSRIERTHRLVRSVGRRFVFDHHQVQEALYQGLPELLREEYHAALAAALETRTSAAYTDAESLDGALCLDLCEHYLKGARGEDALRYLPAAQTHLTGGYLHAQVVALTERALAIPGLLTGAERAKTLLRLCISKGPLDQMGRRLRQEECAREAELVAEQAGDDAVSGQAARALGAVFWRTSRYAEAEAAFRRALETAKARGDRQEEAAATGSLGVVFRSLGRLDEAQEHYERQLALSREIGDRAGEASATGNLGNEFLARGEFAAAKQHLDRYLALSREIGHRRFEAIATGNLGNVFSAQGRLREARDHYERHLTLSREIGHREGEVHAQHTLGVVLRKQGDPARAEECLRACLAMCEEIGHRHLSAATQLALGSLRAAAGDEEGGREALAAARDLAADVGSPATLTLARCELALLPGGDVSDALAAFADNEERLRAANRRSARWLLFRATGDRAHLEEAKRLLDEAVAHVDAETRESMLTNLRVNREITAAWDEHSGDAVVD